MQNASSFKVTQLIGCGGSGMRERRSVISYVSPLYKLKNSLDLTGYPVLLSGREKYPIGNFVFLGGKLTLRGFLGEDVVAGSFFLVSASHL